MSLFVHSNLWLYIESGDRTKYFIIGNVCSQTIMGCYEMLDIGV